MNREQFIRDRIAADLSEGVITIRFNGIIEFANKAAQDILEKKSEELIGKPFAYVFLGEEDNDDFVQCVLDAVYRKGERLEGYVAYHCGESIKQLRVVSSYLKDGDSAVGVILVISDITELAEMRDAILAMEKIRSLNHQLELRNRVIQETFGRYLSDEIVREILDSPDGWKLGGQKQKLTILMSDIRGFTALSERMHPQDLVSMLNHYFSEMYEEIERYQGTLIEFMGDGMLVIFGAPIHNETHASDAVAAAIGMQMRMNAVNRWNVEHGYEEISMGIGINTDDVILGNIGSQRRTKYGVLGSAVNLSGRIEGYTTGGQVLISQGTREAITNELEIRRMFRAAPKGVNEAIQIFDVAGIGEPYNLRLSFVMDEPQPLFQPALVHFSLLEGKQIKGKGAEAWILAISETDARMNTRENLAEFDNLCIDIGQDLYAKVMEIGDEYCRITFTAKPPCFTSWISRICRETNEKEEGD